MSTSPQGVRQRQKEAPNGKKRTGGTTMPTTDGSSDGSLMNGNMGEKIEQVKQKGKEVVQRDWDYKLALAIITVLAFVTRFWGISHPNQVVFDEVHFGKVRPGDPSPE